MSIVELKERPNISTNDKLNSAYVQLGEFLKELRKKELPHNVIESVNLNIEEVNTSSLEGSDLRKLVKKNQSKILKVIEKELKLVPKNHYRNLWLAIGMSAFGLPIGVAFGSLMKNIGLLVLGLPIGLAIGLAVGTHLDKKAHEEGRQLEIELTY